MCIHRYKPSFETVKKKKKKQTWEIRTVETKVGWEAMRQFGRKVDSNERGKEIFSSDNAEQP